MLTCPIAAKADGLVVPATVQTSSPATSKAIGPGIHAPATSPTVIPVTAAVAAPEKLTVAPAKPTFVPLIKGSGLDGWVVHEGKASAWKRDGDIISCTSSVGGWLRTEAAYSDFEVKLEYRLQSGGNTGVGLRCPTEGNPTFTGIEIQLLDDSAAKYSGLRPDQYTGSIYYQVAATQRATLKPVGEWNLCEILCAGETICVKINGEVVNEITLNAQNSSDDGSELPKARYQLSQRPPIGHIALQSHSSRVDFRQIEVKDLTVKTPTGLKYLDLTNGSGEPAQQARAVTVHYVGQLSDGKRFADTRELGTPVTVNLSDVIPGWQEGIRGMRVGGRRRLIVPPSLAYGVPGVGDVIPPDSTLVFEVDLMGVEN